MFQAPGNKYRIAFASLFTVAMVFYAIFVFGNTSACFLIEEGPNSLGLSFGYKYNEVLKFFAIRSEAQLLCYRDFITIWDNIFPFIYGLMYLGWFAVLFKSKWLIFGLPLIRSSADWIENAIEIAMTNQFLSSGTLSAELATWGSVSSMIKWGLSILVYGILTYGIITVIRRKLRS